METSDVNQITLNQLRQTLRVKLTARVVYTKTTKTYITCYSVTVGKRMEDWRPGGQMNMFLCGCCILFVHA